MADATTQPAGQHSRFHIRSLDQLRDEIRQRALSIPTDTDFAPLAAPLMIAGRKLVNRFAVHPMEGFDAEQDGSPGSLTSRRYCRYAAGGYALIWIEATAVLGEARSNPGQLCLHKDNVAGFARLVQSIRQTARERNGFEPVIVIQLTHSGRYSKPAGAPRPIIAHHSPILDPLHRLPPDYPVISDDDLDRLRETYVAAAKLAASAGVDGIDIKSCHRYLVSELLASHTREGHYGGSFENRTRLLRETLAAVRANVPSVFVSTRMNAYDAIPHPYGFGVDRQEVNKPDLREPLRLAGELRKIGIPLLNISIGNPYYNPHYGRPFDFPIGGAKAPDEHPLLGLDRFLAVTRAFQERYPDLPVIGSGYSWLRHFMPNVAAAVIRTGGASILGIGRGSFAYPDTPHDVLRNGAMDPAKCCVACSGCTQIMRDGAMTGCVVRDSDIYGHQYRLGRRFSLDRLQAEARRCRECESATCTMGCPAHVDIPAFIRAFADGDIRRAYDILRASNVLPEMCGCVCPSEAQCEGGCLEKIFCENPIPIRDIQLVACRIARREGYTGIRLPTHESGRHVAVVGAGPAGIAATIRLLEKGHRVTLFERGPKFGGMPSQLIPGDRYGAAEDEVEAILKPARDAHRLLAMFGENLGQTQSLEALRSRFSAVLLATGLGGGVALAGTPVDGVVDALLFLREVKQGARTSAPPRVAVIGGGNTAMDAAVTARKLGAADVYLVYRRSFVEMPAWPRERRHLLESGAHLLLLTQPVGYESGPDGKLKGLRIARTELGPADSSGRRRPTAIPGTESLLSVDLVIEAIGQTMAPELRTALREIELTPAGLVAVAGNGSFATNIAGVYAAGDLVNGGTTAVQGVAEGLQAAAEIDRFLAPHLKSN
jgi:NADPH-dependent glutamate synthase beta subunit-like oxidoreductase/2,4-dienoyl-CoA reductase-like NADH-dependent reductase (Old Yellow Enzyme family)